MNLPQQKIPLTPALSPTEGERVPEGPVRGFRGAMRECPIRGRLSPPAALASAKPPAQPGTARQRGESDGARETFLRAKMSSSPKAFWGLVPTTQAIHPKKAWGFVPIAGSAFSAEFQCA
jgi:hypothetical protein